MTNAKVSMSAYELQRLTISTNSCQYIWEHLSSAGGLQRQTVTGLHIFKELFSGLPPSKWCVLQIKCNTISPSVGTSLCLLTGVTKCFKVSVMCMVHVTAVAENKSHKHQCIGPRGPIYLQMPQNVKEVSLGEMNVQLQVFTICVSMGKRHRTLHTPF